MVWLNPQCRSHSCAVNRGFGRNEEVVSPTLLLGFPRCLPPSAGPLERVQSSCVRLNTMLQGQNWAFI